MSANSNVTIDWISAMELFLRGVNEYQATYFRMLLAAELEATTAKSIGTRPVKGFASTWRLGYNGETAPIATLFPLQGFVLLCAIFVVAMGARTGVKYVTEFDPTNTTHLIVASALGGRNGGLGALRGENAVTTHTEALNLKIEYRDSQGFQEKEVNNHGRLEYTELQNLGTPDATSQRRSMSALFARRPFMRTATG